MFGGSSKLSIQNIIIALAVIFLIGGGAYWFIKSRKPPQEPVLTEDKVKLNIEKEASNILKAVNLIKSIKLDVTIFEDPRFLKLKEVRGPVEINILQGKRNPFAPF